MKTGVKLYNWPFFLKRWGTFSCSRIPYFKYRSPWAVTNERQEMAQYHAVSSGLTACVEIAACLFIFCKECQEAVENVGVQS